MTEPRNDGEGRGWDHGLHRHLMVHIVPTLTFRSSGPLLSLPSVQVRLRSCLENSPIPTAVGSGDADSGLAGFAACRADPGLDFAKILAANCIALAVRRISVR